MKKTLNISADLHLPVEDVTKKNAWLGTTGSGKTYGASKFAEELHAAGAQFIVLDPVGVWFGLRIDADGKSPGLPIPVFGGLHGDIPLEPSAGAIVADLIVDMGLTVILDVSQFESDADKARFGAAFAERFFFRKKASPSAVHLILEECQEFIPERPVGKLDEIMQARFVRIWKLGRNFGIGGSLVSQRPQEVSKRALNLCELVLAFQVQGVHERKAIAEWTAEAGVDDDIKAILPKLEVGHCRAWSPSWLKISKTIKISPKHTFNASSTPEVGSAKVNNRTLAKVDLDRISKDMAATIERAKAEDPKLLQARIRELEETIAQNAGDDHGTANEAQALILQAEERGYDEGRASLKEELVNEYSRGYGDAQVALKTKFEPLIANCHYEITSAMNLVDELSNNFDLPAPSSSLAPAAVPTRPPQTLAARPLSKPAQPAVPTRAAQGDLPPMHRRILTVLAQNGVQPKGIILIHADYSANGATSKAFAELSANGFVEAPVAGSLEITAAGKEALGSYERLPRGRALQQYLQQGSKISPMEKKILAAVCGAYPHGIGKGKILDQVGYSANGATSKAFARLVKFRYVEPAGAGSLKASKELF